MTCENSNYETESLHAPHEAIWNEALDRMQIVADDDEIGAVMDISLASAEAIAAWRSEHSESLTPESIFFLNISEDIKRSIG